MTTTSSLSRLAAALLLGTLSCAAMAQGRQLTQQDYARAERFLGYKTQPLVDHDVQNVKWIEGTVRFWYVDHDKGQEHYKLMDAITGRASDAFDAAKMAAALGTVSKKPVKPAHLHIGDIKPLAGDRIQVGLHGRQYTCELGAKPSCKPGRADAAPPKSLAAWRKRAPAVLSPDGTREAFIRDWNLWIRVIATGKTYPVTSDGVKNDGYATDNAGWTHSDRAILVWSPDSRYIATFQQDQRQDGDMATVGAAKGHPPINVWKYPLPGDKHVTMISRVVIDVAQRKVIRLHTPPDYHRSTLCDDVSCGRDGGWDDVQWGPDSRTLAFVSTSRYHKQEWLRVADVQTGAVHTVFHMTVPTYYESGIGKVNWHYLPKSHEFIWYSWRNNWGNLYLYDLDTGKLKHAITTGSGDVTEVLRVDPATRTLWFRGVGREQGWNPYYQGFYKVSLDGGQPQLLTPQDADHQVYMSPKGRYFVDAYSTPTTPPVTVLRRAVDGKVLATVAKADISRLKAAGWAPPQPITVTARDGKTTLYGMLFKPTNFDPHKTYPVVDYIYPGPQTGSVFGWDFMAARGDKQAMAELGFVVVSINGMGTPFRSKSFQDAWYGDMGDNTLPDQVKGIKELAARYPWMDVSRVGIWGHSGGGFASTDAMLRYPDFFKVGWSESGNHDNRDYEDDWGEKYQGQLVTHKDGSTSYDNQANEDLASHLKGRLMLTYGTLDDNVPPENTQLVVQALIKAGKYFDMIAIPNVHHGYAYATPYITKRRWDYFVTHLAGNQPAPYTLKAWPWR